MSTSSNPNTQQQNPIHFSLSEFQTAVLQASGITLYHCKHKTVESSVETRFSHAEPVANAQTSSTQRSSKQTSSPIALSEHQSVQKVSQADVKKYSALLNDIQVAINLINTEKKRVPLEVMQWWVGDAFSVNQNNVTLPQHPQQMNSTDKRELWRVICEKTR